MLVGPCVFQQKFRKDPYVATLGGFSKVTNYIFDAFRGTEEQHQRPPEEVADLLGEVLPGLEINQQEEPGFEVITRVRPSSTLMGHMTLLLLMLWKSMSPLTPSVSPLTLQIDLGTRPEVTRTGPLSSEDWSKHQDAEGRMINISRLKQTIFKGVRRVHYQSTTPVSLF